MILNFNLLVFAGCVLAVEAVNTSDVEECTIDVKRGEVVLQKNGPLTGQRV